MKKLLAWSAVLLSVSGCTPHQLEIQQGNILSQEKLALLKPGMAAKQVRFVLGTPLLQDPFHPDRWDYYFSREVDGEVKTRYRATLYFENGRYVRMVESGEIPATERDTLK